MNTQENKYKSFIKRTTSIVVAVVFSLSLTCTPSSFAFAESRSSDYIVSGTVEERGLGASEAPNIFATNAILKTSDGKVLFSRDADAEVKIASLTKIMTATVALENSSLDKQIVVSENAVSTGGSNAGLSAGDTMTLSEALYALMIPSGNDAATAIAESVGKDLANTSDSQAGYDAFVAKMNSRAAELGCSHTKFTNPHGLDEDQFTSDSHSSANDLMTIIENAMKIDAFKEAVKNSSYDLSYTNNGEKKTKTLESTDELLDVYDGACGIKTGTTDLAGYCFAGACERDGVMLYSVVLGSSDDSTRFEDTKNLFNWYFNNVVDYKFSNAENDIVAQVSNSAWLDKTIAAKLEDTSASAKVFKYDGNVSQHFTFNNVSGAVKAGDIVGHVDFIQDNKVISAQNIVAAEDCDAPDFLTSLSFGLTRFVHNFTGEANSATTQILNDTPLLIKFN